jgi:hypothetical protein
MMTRDDLVARMRGNLKRNLNAVRKFPVFGSARQKECQLLSSEQELT